MGTVTARQLHGPTTPEAARPSAAGPLPVAAGPGPAFFCRLVRNGPVTATRGTGRPAACSPRGRGSHHQPRAGEAAARAGTLGSLAGARGVCLRGGCRPKRPSPRQGASRPSDSEHQAAAVGGPAVTGSASKRPRGSTRRASTDGVEGPAGGCECQWRRSVPAAPRPGARGMVTGNERGTGRGRRRRRHARKQKTNARCVGDANRPCDAGRRPSCAEPSGR